MNQTFSRAGGKPCTKQVSGERPAACGCKRPFSLRVGPAHVLPRSHGTLCPRLGCTFGGLPQMWHFACSHVGCCIDAVIFASRRAHSPHASNSWCGMQHVLHACHYSAMQGYNNAPMQRCARDRRLGHSILAHAACEAATRMPSPIYPCSSPLPLPRAPPASTGDSGSRAAAPSDAACLAFSRWLAPARSRSRS